MERVKGCSKRDEARVYYIERRTEGGRECLF